MHLGENGMNSTTELGMAVAYQSTFPSEAGLKKLLPYLLLPDLKQKKLILRVLIWKMSRRFVYCHLELPCGVIS